MHKRGYAVVQRLSACLLAGCLGSWLAVTFVYCIETAKDTVIVTTECE